MRSVEFILPEYLKRHHLSAYRLAEASRGRLSRATVYSLARGDVRRVDLSTLGTVLTTLEELTGEELTVADLLRTVTIPDEPADMTEWQAADLVPELPAYDWGEPGEPAGEPVRYVPGVGFVAGQP